MKIIKSGKFKITEPMRITCNNCEAQLEYTHEDYLSTTAHNDMNPRIQCPECKQLINLKNEEN